MTDDKMLFRNKCLYFVTYLRLGKRTPKNKTEHKETEKNTIQKNEEILVDAQYSL